MRLLCDEPYPNLIHFVQGSPPPYDWRIWPTEYVDVVANGRRPVHRRRLRIEEFGHTEVRHRLGRRNYGHGVPRELCEVNMIAHAVEFL